MQIKISKHCESCDLLSQLLEIERHEKQKLLDKLVELMTPVTQTMPANDPPAPINRSRFVPFRIQRQILEEESRAKARIMAEMGKNQEIKMAPEQSVEELERELGVDDAVIK